MQVSSDENVLKTIDNTRTFGVLNIDNLDTRQFSDYLDVRNGNQVNRVNIFRNRNGGRMHRFMMLNPLDQEVVVEP